LVHTPHGRAVAQTHTGPALFTLFTPVFQTCSVHTPQGLLTPTFKLKRNEAKKKYADAIDAMYKAGPAPTKAKL